MERQPRQSPGAFNEAMMELGATLCTPRAPRCEACPIATSCAALRKGNAASLPAKKERRVLPTVRVAVALVRRGDTLLLEKRERGLLAGTWALPAVELDEDDDAVEALADKVASLAGAPARVAPEARRGKHAFTHKVWMIEAYDVRCKGTRGEWRDPREVALATAHRKML
jgi:A/G-specific adenine glycosylase